ncbi:hypothetical protein IMY05_010G0130400 [Salix suchowensis]|nr:hypothetical protein IMY05_010G0130400 [Salix suchowensis]
MEFEELRFSAAKLTFAGTRQRNRTGEVNFRRYKTEKQNWNQMYIKEFANASELNSDDERGRALTVKNKDDESSRKRMRVYNEDETDPIQLFKKMKRVSHGYFSHQALKVFDV